MAAGKQQFGVNASHRGDAGLDTGDFGDKPPRGPGNLRVDFVLPSSNLEVFASGVFWPLDYQPSSKLAKASDHRLVWVDLAMR